MLKVLNPLRVLKDPQALERLADLVLEVMTLPFLKQFMYLLILGRVMVDRYLLDLLFHLLLVFRLLRFLLLKVADYNQVKF